MLPYTTIGKENGEPLVFISGFPDDQLSACAPLVDQLKEEYLIIAICFKDFELTASEINKAKPWGYSFPELDRMLDATINHNLGNSTNFTLVIHDWGSILGLIYENKRPERVKRLVIMDVGIKKSISLYDGLVIILYQWWFSIAYLMSQILGSFIGNLIFLAFNIFRDFFPFLTIGPMKVIRPQQDISVHQCYPYFEYWKAYMTNMKDIAMKFPSCPLLYVVNCMYFSYYVVIILLINICFLLYSMERKKMLCFMTILSLRR